jgi:hypothetical protein
MASSAASRVLDPEIQVMEDTPPYELRIYLVGSGLTTRQMHHSAEAELHVELFPKGQADT